MLKLKGYTCILFKYTFDTYTYKYKLTVNIDTVPPTPVHVIRMLLLQL